MVTSCSECWADEKGNDTIPVEGSGNAAPVMKDGMAKKISSNDPVNHCKVGTTVTNSEEGNSSANVESISGVDETASAMYDGTSTCPLEEDPCM